MTGQEAPVLGLGRSLSAGPGRRKTKKEEVSASGSLQYGSSSAVLVGKPFWSEEADASFLPIDPNEPNEPESETKPQFPQKTTSAMLAIYAGLLLVCSTGNSLFFKKMTNRFPNYPYFLSQFTTFVYIPVFWAVVAYEYFFTSFITPQMLKFSKFKFFVMGALDSLAGVFM